MRFVFAAAPCARPGRARRRAGAGPHLQEIDDLQAADADDKLATYGIDDPVVEGVACHFTVPERGGVAGALGVAEEVSDISLACRQIGPIAFKEKFEQGDVVFRERRSILFKKMQIVRGCDVKRNVLVYRGLFRQAGRGLPEELDVDRADHALGRGDGVAEMRGLGGVKAAAGRDLTSPGFPGDKRRHERQSATNGGSSRAICIIGIICR